MQKLSNIFQGNQQLQQNSTTPEGVEVELNGEVFYKISYVDAMRPFFISVVSNSDHWLFVSSNGGISAGRKNSDFALFPYYTDDKITESNENTGCKSIFLVSTDGKTFLWEPFSNRQKGIYSISRNIYKNAFGNKIIFEEFNHDLELVFTYEWNSSEKFGFIRHSKIKNLSNIVSQVRVLDGIQNILPYGVEQALQNSTSNLVDAYKKCELEEDFGLGIYSLSAIIVDKAEPSEALKANTVYSVGLNSPIRLISSLQLESFRLGNIVKEERDIRAEKGAYFLVDEIQIAPNSEEKWSIVANVNQSMKDIVNITESLKNPDNLKHQIHESIEKGTQELIALVAGADGIQLSQDKTRNVRHFANTMFNIMRGGIFDNNYAIERDDFSEYLRKANLKLYKDVESKINELPVKFDLTFLKDWVTKIGDKDLQRLSLEYLPLKFSRRHGDPSRPWNKFSINTRNEYDGSKILDFQGNWRDIFQNWEALAHSYPEFIEGMMVKFLNASTFEGYNPYRVTKEGFDWETIEPDNPWSYIGYWGDHQIIYLLKFLEFIEDYYPQKLQSYFSKDFFVYANVPYKIKSYSDILTDPKNTIEFDHAAEKNILEIREKIGFDGALLREQSGNIYTVNFIEKILATLLAKMSNFIPEGGIWMNTQRPEWNDANNALVGNGVSMVTLYYLRRFVGFFKEILEAHKNITVLISEELITFFNQVLNTLKIHQSLLFGRFSDKQRKEVLDGLGKSGSDYRNKVYQEGFSGTKKEFNLKDFLEFCDLTIYYLEHSIAANKRDDGLYHAYNLMTLQNYDEVSISYLSEMLEGQVAVLSSGFLSTNESLKVLESLRASALYRPDQNSYLLYPNKELPRFINKNNISKKHVESCELLLQLLKDGNSQIIVEDALGGIHFNGNFKNADDLKKALLNLPNKYYSLVQKEKGIILEIFESIFNHKSFTGRSGTFFGYEGLGSIYWHMVSKLLLATYEVTNKVIDENSLENIAEFKSHFHEINKGIGAHKEPTEYGAFPTDPYSHTPAGKGAQQPGMTGQVKEDILSRFGELGVIVREGKLMFNPVILNSSEFLNSPKTFVYYNIHQERCEVYLNTNSLAFTYCQVPVIYEQSDKQSITVEMENGKSVVFNGSALDSKITTSIFNRSGSVKRIYVKIVENS